MFVNYIHIAVTRKQIILIRTGAAKIRQFENLISDYGRILRLIKILFQW